MPRFWDEFLIVDFRSLSGLKTFAKAKLKPINLFISISPHKTKYRTIVYKYCFNNQYAFLELSFLNKAYLKRRLEKQKHHKKAKGKIRKKISL